MLKQKIDVTTHQPIYVRMVKRRLAISAERIDSGAARPSPVVDLSALYKINNRTTGAALPMGKKQKGKNAEAKMCAHCARAHLLKDMHPTKQTNKLQN